MKPKDLDISKIRIDGGTQMRVAIDEATVADYGDKLSDGEQFDPIDVFFDGTDYWLADGFHRFHGAKRASLGVIPAVIHQGTCRDAVLFAAGANARHGLRRTNADKRKAVEALLNDSEWVKWSDRQIAEKAAVSVFLVNSIRHQLLENNSSTAAQAADKPRVGKDGKERKPPAKKPEPPVEVQGEFADGNPSWCSICQDYIPDGEPCRHQMYVLGDGYTGPGDDRRWWNQFVRTGPGDDRRWWNQFVRRAMHEVGGYLGGRLAGVLAASLRAHRYHFFYRESMLGGGFRSEISLPGVEEDLVDEFNEAINEIARRAYDDEHLAEHLQSLWCLWSGDWMGGGNGEDLGIAKTPDWDIVYAEAIEAAVSYGCKELGQA